MSINTKKIKTEMKSQLNIDVVQVSVDGIDEEGAPVSRSESFDGFGFDSTADNSDFNPFGGAQESEKNPFNQSGRIVNTPTTLNIFRQPNLQIKVCFSTRDTQPGIRETVSVSNIILFSRKEKNFQFNLGLNFLTNAVPEYTQLI